MNKKNDLALQQVNNPTPEQLIASAIQKNVPVETIEKLMALRDKLRAEYAQEEYYKALSIFQANCPKIEKKKDGGKTDAGKVAYKYAPLDDIIEAVKDVLEENGFSYRFEVKMNGKVFVTCIAHHKAGHNEQTSMESDMSTRTRVMSAPQQVAATVTFLKRYAFCNAFGIMTADEDNDGQDLKNPPGDTVPKAPAYLNEFQEKEIVRLGILLGYTKESIQEYLVKSLKVEDFKKIPFQKAGDTIMSMLKKVKEKKSDIKNDNDQKTQVSPEDLVPTEEKDPTDEWRAQAEQANEHYCDLHKTQMKDRGKGIWDHRARLNDKKQPDPKGMWHYCMGNKWHLSITQQS